MRSFRHSATAAIAATALAAALALTAGPPAQAAEQTIAVDVSQTTAPSHAGVGRGFLYGLSFDGTQPADPILGPIKPTSFRSGGEIDQAGSLGWHEGGEATFLPRYQAFAAQTARVTNPPYAAYMDMIVSDLWGSDGPAAGHREYARPCDEVAGAYDCTDWVDFLTSLIGHLGTDGLLNNQVRFDIWNEPADNAGFWPRLREQYWLMWDTGVRTIRALYPQAVIVGPSSGTYNGTREQLYLDHFHTESTMPDVWNWHFSTDPVADAVNMRARLVAKDPAYATIPLTMNEYLLNNSGTNEQTAGHLAWYLARLQRTEISGAAHAIWNNCCGSGRLCSALTMESAQLRTTGEYWVYEASASATGQVVQSVGAVGGVDVLATRDDTAKKIQLLMGARANSGSRFDGTATAQIAGLDDAPAIAGAGRVRVTVKHLANGRLDAPVTVSSVVVPVVDGAVSVPVAWADYHDAYTVTLTSAEERQFAVDDGSYGNRLDQFAFGPGWSAATASNAAGRSLTRASGPATAVFTFAGSAIDLAVLKGPDQGIFTVSLDGGAPESVDAYAEGPAAPAIAWSAAGLGTGTHTVAIRATGQKNPASSAATVSIDEATVTSATPIVVVDDNVMGSGLNQWQSWVQGASGGGVATGIADLYAGTTHWASSTALSATIAFVGSRIELSAIYDTDQRTSTVWLDGTQRASINMRSDDRRTHEIAWDSGALTYGSHTLEVRVGGQIALDFVRIYEGELDVPVDAPQAVSVAETVRQGAGSSPVPLAFGGAGATDVAIDRAPGHGTAVAGGLGVAYTPEPGFYGVDTFSYRAVNEAGASAPATATVYVTDPTASAIALEATPAAIVSGATVALSAVLLGAGGTPLGPLELDDSAYAIVGGVAQEAVLGGAATLLIAGERTVAASFAGVQGQTNVTVEPGPPVRVSASVLGATGNLTAGVPVQLAVAGYDAAGNAFDVTGRYEFSSSQASDAVEGTELVATAAGRRTVTATRYRDDGLSEETRLTVRVAAAAPATVNAEPVGPSAVADGGVAVFRVWTADPYGNEVGDVSASAVLTSTASGDTISANRVTVQGTGLRLITATSGSWTSTPATLTVVGDASAPEPTPTVTVPVPGPTVTVNVPVPGPTVPVPGPTVNVPVPGPTVAVPVPGPTVNVPVPGPTVTALADPGTLTDREALAPIARVKAAQQAIVLVKGRSATVPALAYLADGSKAPGTLTWKSANPRIASVARSGTILAKRAGRVLVTATASDGAAASIAVTVVGAKPKAAKAKAVTVRSVPKTMSVGAVAYATVSHTPARIAGAKVRFASSDTTILAVDEAGRIVARSPGTAILKATVAGKSKSVSVTVR